MSNESPVKIYERRRGEWVPAGEISREQFDALRPTIDRYNAETQAVRALVADWNADR